MLRAEGHKNFPVLRNAGMRSKDHSATFAKVEKIPVGVPYVLVRKAVWKDVRPLGEVEG